MRKGAKYMIRIAVADDDKECTRQLCQYIDDFARESGQNCDVTVYHDGDELVERYKAQFDIILLDVEMPFLNGMTAAELIRRQDPEVIIIFITNMAQYAIRGYEVNAIDFIVKPVSYYVFADKLRKAIQFSKNHAEKDFVIQTEDSIFKITCSQIIYVEKDKNYLVLHTKRGDHRIRGTMASMEESLKNEGFSKCISGCLLNLRYVTGVDKDTVWVEDTPLPLSRQRKKEFKEDFMRYLGGGF